MDRFKALRIHESDGRPSPRLETLGLDDLSAGAVVIRGEWSSVNYKDALAITGAGKIMRRFPLVAGVDVAGRVLSSDDDRYSEGDPVLVVGCGLGETRDGGFSELTRVPADALVPIPPGLSTREAMAIGTAGFTAALALDRMEHNGQHPDLGPLLVSGATGGVGSLAISMAAGLDYRVTALTGKVEAAEYLEALGASEIIDRREITPGTRPLERAIWGGAIDSLGGPLLGWLTRTTVPHGNIACIGLAAGIELETTVMPLILRGVNLLGINSVDVPLKLRTSVWRRLAGDLRPAHLERIVTREIGLEDLADAARAWVDGKITGRAVVRLS